MRQGKGPPGGVGLKFCIYPRTFLGPSGYVGNHDAPGRRKCRICRQPKINQALDTIAHVAFEPGVDPEYALAFIKKVADDALSRTEDGEQVSSRAFTNS